MLKSFGEDTHTITISLLKSFRDNYDYNSIEHTVLSLHQYDTRKAHKTQAHTRILIRLDSTITLEQLPELGFDSSIAIDALASGAFASGLSGTGSAFVAIVDDNSINDVKESWSGYEGRVIETYVDNEGCCLL